MKKVIVVLGVLLGISSICNAQSSPNLNFDGIDDYVDLGNTVGNGVRTIELWFKPSTTIDQNIGDWLTLIQRNNTLCDGCFGLHFLPSGFPNAGKLRFQKRQSGPVEEIFSNDSVWNANQWYHVAAVIDSLEGMALYINGLKQIEIDTNPEAKQATGNLNKMTAIGVFGDYGQRFFNGNIEDVRLSNIARYNSSFTPSCNQLSTDANTLGLWNFNEGVDSTTYDSSSNGYNGIIHGATWDINDICNPFSSENVLQFDGINDYVNLGSDVGNGIRSIEFWFKPNITIDNTLSTPAGLVHRNAVLCLGCFGFTFNHTGWSNPGTIRFKNRASGTNYEVYTNSNTWNANQWYHIAGVIDPIKGMMLYVNGIKQIDTNAYTGNSGTFTEFFAVGDYGDLTNRYFNGKIDEVRFWDRAISQNEIQSKMCDTINPMTETGLVGYYPFNDGIGTVASDLSGNSYNGTINEAIWDIDTICASDPCLTTDCVWPGDANNNGVANVWDILPVGIAYNQTGAVRPSASLNWTGQPNTDWSGTFLNGTNYKHADCLGDGEVSINDLGPIFLNYGQVHNKTSQINGGPGDPELFIELDIDYTIGGTLVTALINFGTDSVNAQNVYGMAFSIGYNPLLVDTNSLTFGTTNSWLGNPGNSISIYKNLPASGQVDIGITRIDQMNASGYGTIGALSFFSTDNLNGKTAAKYLNLNIQNVQVIANDESNVAVNVNVDSVLLIGSGIQAQTDLSPFANIYPMPANEQLNIKVNILDVQKIEIFNMLGKLIFSDNSKSKNVNVNTKQMNTGLYLVRINTLQGNIDKKLVINH